MLYIRLGKNLWMVSLKRLSCIKKLIIFTETLDYLGKKMVMPVGS